jgi:alkanesulfonate monooxygenase SsuD/methylene tetrahydromethanopterin reductase-like flavin-dependent oxidoreductase (luciferase family)
MAMSVIRFDLRRAGSSDVPFADLYREALAMSAWADEVGFDMCVLSEHHGDEGGYLPAPLVMAGAVAGRTRRIPIFISALLVPLHEPVRLAEDLAVLDLVSGGRVSFVTGIGYRPSEYALLGKDFHRRGKLLDEALETLLAVWRGEALDRDGHRVRVLPQPLSQPHPMLFIGGSSKVAARRAARFGLGLFPSAEDASLADAYYAACEELGTTPGMVLMPKGPACVFVSDDPDRLWAEIGPLLLDDAQAYAAHLTDDMTSQAASGATTVDELRAEGVYRIHTPDECVALAGELGPMAGVVLHPLCAGVAPDVGWASLELYRDAVLPRLAGG